METKCEIEMKNIKSEFEIKHEELDIQMSCDHVFTSNGIISNKEFKSEEKLEEEETEVPSHFLENDDGSEQVMSSPGPETPLTQPIGQLDTFLLPSADDIINITSEVKLKSKRRQSNNSKSKRRRYLKKLRRATMECGGENNLEMANIAHSSSCNADSVPEAQSEITPHEDQPYPESQNPWPHLEDYFTFMSRDAQNVNLLYFQCVLCHPKKTFIKAHASSFYNLKSHVRRNHITHSGPFQERIKAFSCRGKYKSFSRISAGSTSNSQSSQSLESSHSQSSQPLESSHSQSSQPLESSHSQSSQPLANIIRQSTDDNASDRLAVSFDVNQCVLDTMIVNLFVSNMLPLRVVDSPSFVNLIQTLKPSYKPMCHGALAMRISFSRNQLEDYLIRLLKDIPWVATTADCWLVNNKSYLGMTAHWLNPKTRMREHALLACFRLKGHHTSDIFAEAIVGTHKKFHLQDKVTRVTMDNGRNFIKKFVQFGTETDLLLDIPMAAADSRAECVENENLALNFETEAMDQVEFISIEGAFENSSGPGHNFPAFMRCATHTFNLIVSVDADKALNSAPFKMAYRNAMSKAQALWDQQICSTAPEDITLKELKRVLVIPKDTSWSSTYYSVVVLNNVLERKWETVHKAMTQLKLQTFTNSDVDFLKEYAQVMSVVSKALNVMEWESQTYLGSLLPIVTVVVTKLNDAKSKGFLYCNPLIDAILAGITKRFGPLLQNQEFQLASAFHPKFRLFGLEKHNHIQYSNIKKAMETAVETALRKCNNTTSNEDEEDDFFIDIIQSQRSLKLKAQNLVKTWLAAASEETLTDHTFFSEQVLIDLFIKYNTAIPSSSAVVGRLFSKGKDILRLWDATLPDAQFERMMFIKGNQHHFEAMKKEELEIKQNQL